MSFVINVTPQTHYLPMSTSDTHLTKVPFGMSISHVYWSESTFKSTYFSVLKIHFLVIAFCMSIWISAIDIYACGKKEEKGVYMNQTWMSKACRWGGATMNRMAGQPSVFCFKLLASELRSGHWMSSEAQTRPPFQIWAVDSSWILRYLWKTTGP